jgi:hypothetical protein
MGDTAQSQEGTGGAAMTNPEMDEGRSDDETALLQRAMRDDAPAAADIRYHLVSFLMAMRHGDRYEAAVHHQQATRLLEQYARSRPR